MQIHKKLFIFLSAIFVVPCLADSHDLANKNFLFFNSVQLEQIRDRFQTPSEEYEAIKDQILEGVEYFIDEGPWSVTFTKSPAISGNPHDYFSESPYWWPDPDNPDGPYIRRDGERNPDRFNDHKKGINHLFQAVSTLILAGYFFDNPEYSKKAATFLRIWFLDEKTKMNPHLDYGQAIRNKSPGRGVGIIDTHRFPKLLEAVYILEYSGHVDSELFAGLRNWFAQYLNWMLTSENGLDEKQRGNNHGSWWCTQTAAYAQFTGNGPIQRTIFEYARDTIIAGQFEEVGRQPHELERTRSFQYAVFNLDALSLLARMAGKKNIALWKSKKGKGTIHDGVKWMHKYIRFPENWQYKQIVKVQKEEPLFLLFAGEDLGKKQWIETYKQHIQFGDLPEENMMFDPFIILINLYTLTFYGN